MTMIHLRPTTLDLAMPTPWWWLPSPSWLSWLPWVLMALEALTVLTAAGQAWVRRARQRRWQVGARLITILAPPHPDPDGAAALWGNLDQVPFDASEFVENPEPRCPCISG